MNVTFVTPRAPGQGPLPSPALIVGYPEVTGTMQVCEWEKALKTHLTARTREPSRRGNAFECVHLIRFSGKRHCLHPGTWGSRQSFRTSFTDTMRAVLDLQKQSGLATALSRVLFLSRGLGVSAALQAEVSRKPEFQIVKR